MTDDERRTDIDESLRLWWHAQIARGHPAGLIKERITVVKHLGFNALGPIKQMRDSDD